MSEEIANSLSGKLQKNLALADFTSWRVGGPADVIYFPAGIQDLSHFLQTIDPKEQIIYLGLGSNTLIRDGGVKGTVIITQGRLKEITQLDELIIRAEAGVACPAIARHTARLGLKGIEFLAGVPGTVGGALAMNAGCHGGETWDHVIAVETIDRKGQIHLRLPEQFEVGYRHVKSKEVQDEWFLAAHFKLEHGDKESILERIRKLLDHRTATQPTNIPNCGSVFRNPPDDYAARLIQECGLKGKQIGGASVSDKHANFIVNNGNATARDIEALIELVANEVKAKHNIDLIREVRIFGNL